MDELIAKPFLKWAGGKSQLLPQFKKYYPLELRNGKIKKYIEPFLGGGAVFFDLQSKYNFNEVILNDINKQLILSYYTIQNNVDDLTEILYILEKKYLNVDMEEKEKIFYTQRDEFNKFNIELNIKNISSEQINHTAKMIFLNKTCFNGLYRENRNGKFNVPFGKREKATICDDKNLRAVHNALSGVILKSLDFQELTLEVNKNTFLYIDPPYRPLSNTSAFTSYSKIPFDDESQIRLSKWAKVINAKGAHFMLSNSDPTNVNKDDTFIEKLYSEFNINRVTASRAINSKGNGRGQIKELLINNNLEE